MISEPGIYIGIGMVLSLLATETLGVTAGGIIVPGYIAMHLDLEHAIMIVVTFGISIITFLIIKTLSRFILIYGKRRLVLALLLGFLLGYLTRSDFLLGYLTQSELKGNLFINLILRGDLVVIGNIIPGLIANWMDRQGVLRTICTVLIISSITRLIIITLEILI